MSSRGFCLLHAEFALLCPIFLPLPQFIFVFLYSRSQLNNIWFVVSAAHPLFCHFSTLSPVQHPTSQVPTPECKPAEGLCQEAQSSLPSSVPEQALDPFAQCLAKMPMDDVDNAAWRLLVLSGMVSLMCVVFPSMLPVSAPLACESSHTEVAHAVAAEKIFLFLRSSAKRLQPLFLSSPPTVGLEQGTALMPGCPPPTKILQQGGLQQLALSTASCTQGTLGWTHSTTFLPKGSHFFFVFNFL